MNTSPATVKGLIIKGIIRFLRETYAEEGFRKFLDHLPEEDREVWTGRQILATSKVPAIIYKNAYEAIETLWGKGDGKKFEEVAGVVAFYDLNTVMKFFMKVGSPGFVAQRLPSVWKQYFGAGTARLFHITENQMEIILEGAEEYGAAGCAGTLGWTRAAMKYAGAKNLKLTQKECIRDGAPRCHYVYSWE
ncbi:MAG TPA: hypothetical protein PLT76_07110 [Candidatus Omnitrophota bacterium]|nr:hypothetical protein [Candidatus Omnitrophota bacterium]HQO58475.1 hypothetical protein [Candidatus Omnitrophota bacterium]